MQGTEVPNFFVNTRNCLDYKMFYVLAGLEGLALYASGHSKG